MNTQDLFQADRTVSVDFGRDAKQKHLREKTQWTVNVIRSSDDTQWILATGHYGNFIVPDQEVEPEKSKMLNEVGDYSYMAHMTRFTVLTPDEIKLRIFSYQKEWFRRPSRFPLENGDWESLILKERA